MSVRLPAPGSETTLAPRASLQALWPTPGQELLLRAAMTSGRRALEAWDAWKAGHDLIETELDHGSFRLLALVYKNLLAEGADEPLMPRLKGIYRYWWCSNQHLFYRAAAVIRELEGAGIPTIVLKGAAASVAYYRDTGVRPMGDIDLLVPVERAAEAIAHLGRLGWRPARPRVADLIRYQHSVRMEHDNGEVLDLHWHVLAECVHPAADDGFWKRAVPIRVLDSMSRALGPSDALLHTIVHGMRWNAEPTVRWVADAMAILRAAPDAIDWAVVEREARRQHVVLRLRMGLAYLKRHLGAVVPDRVLERLRRTSPVGIERMEYHVLAVDADGQALLRPGHLLLVLVQYMRFMAGKSLLQQIAETPSYVRYRLRGRRRTLGLLRGLQSGVRGLLPRRSLPREAA